MLKALILTLQFLTRLPIHIQIDVDRKIIAKGTFYYPFIGMLIGGIAAVVYVVICSISQEIASIAAVFAMIAVTGGFHLDGLSDTADGFYSSRTREKILEIMKDSHIGAFGVVAIVFDIMMKYILIKELGVTDAVIALIVSCGLGRTSSAMLFSFGKSARPGGLGDQVTNNGTRIYFLISTVLFSIIGIFTANIAFISAILVVLVFSVLFMIYSYKVIGGLTGDVYGAACELSEILSLLTFVAVKAWI